MANPLFLSARSRPPRSRAQGIPDRCAAQYELGPNRGWSVGRVWGVRGVDRVALGLSLISVRSGVQSFPGPLKEAEAPLDLTGSGGALVFPGRHG